MLDGDAHAVGSRVGRRSGGEQVHLAGDVDRAIVGGGPAAHRVCQVVDDLHLVEDILRDGVVHAVGGGSARLKRSGRGVVEGGKAALEVVEEDVLAHHEVGEAV